VNQILDYLVAKQIGMVTLPDLLAATIQALP
jgi:hypothetical protein